MKDAEFAMRALYGNRDDFQFWMERCVETAFNGYKSRPADLKQLDLNRTLQPDWYLNEEMIGYICYTDRFSGDLASLPEKIPYLKELGITYLHLMPLLQPRPDPNDGGYAVLDYRRVDSRVGTMEDLAAAAQELRRNGISLVQTLSAIIRPTIMPGPKMRKQETKSIKTTTSLTLIESSQTDMKRPCGKFSLKRHRAIFCMSKTWSDGSGQRLTRINGI